MRFLCLIFIICGLAYGQGMNALFGTVDSPSYTTTLTQTDTFEVSQKIEFNAPVRIDGSLTLSGYALAVSGTAQTVTVSLRMLHATDMGPAHTLGTITAAADTTWWEFGVSGESWWTYCDGYQVTFTVPSTGTHTTEIKARGKYK